MTLSQTLFPDTAPRSTVSGHSWPGCEMTELRPSVFLRRPLAVERKESFSGQGAIFMARAWE